MNKILVKITSADQVKDFRGKQIHPGAIVGMSDNDRPWSSFQGLVAAPFSDIKDDGYCVAVFFNKEVSSYHFNSSHFELEKWNYRYEKEMATGDSTFLFKKDIWLKCPRIVFFRPEELVIQEEWSLTALAERLL